MIWEYAVFSMRISKMWSYAGTPALPTGGGLGDGGGVGVGDGEPPDAAGIMLPAQPVCVVVIMGLQGTEKSPAPQLLYSPNPLGSSRHTKKDQFTPAAL